MTAASEGTVGVSITAGHLYPTDRPPTRIGKQVWMGEAGDLTIHIDPATAKQWIGVLTPIAESENNA